MNLPPTLAETVAPYRTLFVEGHEGVHRGRLFTRLAQLGFPLQRPPTGLHHLDPARPYRELLAAPGRFVIDGGVIGELVYGPLRRGRSRVTWIEALDLAEAIAEREGAMLHLTGGEHGGDHRGEHCGESGDEASEAAAAALAYARVFETLAQHVPVVNVHVTPVLLDVVTERARRIRAPAHRQSQLRQQPRQLTVG
ncbi:hypothetical protein PV396_31275 [Streptomyces sp. ME02-8801-2C]|uniref:hypothetical protein n=1 Tax=Streptomyces sp. ME02-8801-2C TaxID=3028680 RepID=UPI0029B79BF2|nr:hypothetical protein [Streptomyces sp. ME02-8801-2C]MDX3456374.1 hypothetical protein [Streptomyces sp. ME02-8801-2C]